MPSSKRNFNLGSHRLTETTHSYISELSPAPYRGRLVTISVLFITFGQVVAYIIGYLLSHQPHGWKLMVGLGALPALVQFFTLAYLPETPRWLIKVGRNAQAKSVLQKMYGPGDAANRVVAKVLRGIEVELFEEVTPMVSTRQQNYKPRRLLALVLRSTSFDDLLHVPGNRRALIIACLLQGLQQLCGFLFATQNSLMYFSATIFALVGFKSPTLASLSIAVTNLLMTIIAVLLIDRVGRRRMLLYSIPIMIVALFLCSLSFTFLPSFTYPDASENAASAWPMLILLCLVLYVASYALGLGNVPWQQSELFPLSVRSVGSGLSTATNWGANFVIGLTFLPMMDVLTPQGTFVIYAFICIAGWFAIWRYYPEMSGLSLEQVGELLAKDYKYWPEIGHPIRRDLDAVSKGCPMPQAVRKMGVDEGEKFFMEYWGLGDNTILQSQRQALLDREIDSAGTSDLRPRSETDDQHSQYANGSMPLPYKAPFVLHTDDQSPLKSRSRRSFSFIPAALRSRSLRAAVSILQKRDFKCPTDTVACTGIDRPYSCCATGESCAIISDTGLGDVGCCQAGENGCAGDINTCDTGFTKCPSSLGGGCCIPDYDCVGVGSAHRQPALAPLVEEQHSLRYHPPGPSPAPTASVPAPPVSAAAAAQRTATAPAAHAAQRGRPPHQLQRLSRPQTLQYAQLETPRPQKPAPTY
ncbi:MAG: hypothetical protein M1825_002784 [Sarcosagium campestre]|nr:MAG: hypothetical protein M1825_002784 [Sarcosagium campestre]